MKDSSIALSAKLEQIVISNQYASISFSLDNPCSLNRWLVSAAVCMKNYDLDADVRCTLDNKIVAGSETDTELKNEIENNWRYYISDDNISFYKRNSPEKMFSAPTSKTEEKYIYALNCVIANKEAERLIHISTMMPMPLRLWINGELVFADTIAFIQKNHILSYRFRKGINTILVEKPLCAWNRRLHMTPKYFSISIRPKDTVINNEFAYEVNESSILAKYLEQYTIIPNKLFYEINEPIQLFVTSNNSASKKIDISLSSSFEDIYIDVACNTGNIISIPTNSSLCGVIKISVGKQSSFVFMGCYSEYIVQLKEKIKYIDTKELDVYSLLFNADILDASRGLVVNAIEPIHSYYSQPVLKKLFALENYFRYHELSNALVNGFIALESPIDRVPFACCLELPNDYDKGKLYPLVVHLNFDDSLTRIPTNPIRVLKTDNSDIVSLTLCGRGDYINDYINSYEIIYSIREIIKSYKIDSDRVSLVGLCTGGRRGFELINKYRNIFSAMFSFASTSISSQETTRIVPMIQLCNIDDMFYNGATVLSRTVNTVKNTFSISGFEHEELIDYYCHSGIVKLITPYQRKMRTENDIQWGIKGIYLNPCCVVKPNLSDREKERKLLLLLTKPIISRARNYNVPVIEITDEAKMDSCNLVFIIDPNMRFKCPSDVLDVLNRLVDKFSVVTDSDFITITENPFNPQKKAVFITYSNSESLDRIMDLWSSFEVNELLYKSSIIINEKELPKMNEMEVREKVIEIINSVLENVSITEKLNDDDLSQLGIDSIKFISIIVAIEEAYEIEVPDEYLLIAAMNTIDKMVTVVLDALGNKAVTQN